MVHCWPAYKTTAWSSRLWSLSFPPRAKESTEASLRRTRAILKIAEKDGPLTAGRLAEVLGVSRNTAKSRMEALTRAEVLEELPTAPNQAKVWKLTDRRLGFKSALPDPDSLEARWREVRPQPGQIDSGLTPRIDTPQQPEIRQRFKALATAGKGLAVKPR